MLLLTDYMVNSDKPNGDSDWGWCAGDQLEALRYYLGDTVEIVTSHKDRGYDGEMVALLKIGDVYILWRDDFGSCSACDGLEGSDGYDYIKATLAEGNTRQFDSVEAAREYIETTDDFLWEYKSDCVLQMLNDMKGGDE